MPLRNRGYLTLSEISRQVAVTWRFTTGDADAYGRGLGMVLLAMAGALALKSHTEPERKL